MTLIRKCIEELAAYVPGEQPAGRDIIKLNTNENPYPPSPRVAAALAAYPADRLRLYSNPVSQGLRETIARRHRCRVEQVFAGNGSDEILALCTRAFVEDEGSVGYFVPSYSLYPVLAGIRNVATRPIPLTDRFAWPFEPKGRRLPGGYDCSLFLLTNPNAPTGMQVPVAKVEALCRALSGVVVIDEAYVDFARENCLALATRLPNVLVMRTLSKSYSLAGLRVGYTVGHPRLIEALFKVKDSYNLDALAQALATAALQDTAWMRGNVRKIRATRRRLTAALRARGHEVYPSETNFIWVRPQGIAPEALFAALRQRNIFIRYFPGPVTGGQVRITIGTDAQIDRLLAVLDQVQRRSTP